MEMTELEFKIYSNALVEIGKIIGAEGKTLESIRYGDNGFVKFPITSYLGARCPSDFVLFDRKQQRFIEIQYFYTSAEVDLDLRKINIPEYLGSVDYI